MNIAEDLAGIEKDKPVAVTAPVQTLGKKTRTGVYTALTEHSRVLIHHAISEEPR